jgi:protocatechuate 3,4-dioxygenase beta subunit
MKRVFVILVGLGLLSACAGAATQVPAIPLPTATISAPSPNIADPTATSVAPTVTAQAGDFFPQMGITLPEPVCNGLTQFQTEGPYYKPDTPERNSLLEEGMPGTRLILVGYVLDQNCQPLAGARLDFWQADANGEYDNAGYRLRGHQFADAQGRYYLETILPGLYSSRPIEHIHVKIQPQGGMEVTSQLYFSQQPVEGLTVSTENKGDYLLGTFNFVLQR